jgi:4-amino-4-deoxy-L-arabinose transferase-like glycosyltransferase
VCKKILVAAIAGLALRLLFGFTYWTGQPLTRDEQEYLAIARSVAAGRGFVVDAGPSGEQTDPFGRAPGYPAFLALVGGGGQATASVPASVKAAQAVVGATGILLIGLITARLAGPRPGWIAAWIAACYPPLVWVSAYAFSEALFWPVGLAAAWLFGRGAPDLKVQGSMISSRVSMISSRGYMAVAGVVAGAGVLIRPAMLFFVVLGAAWLLKRRAVGLALVFLLGSAVAVAPWTARNFAHYGRMVLVATEGGVTFWTGNHPLAIGDGDLAANPELKRANLALRARYPALSEEQMEPVYYEEAFAWIRAHPGRWLALEIRKLFYLVVPIGPSYRLHSHRYYVASVISYALVLPPALLGLWRLGARRRLAPGLWLLGASAVVTSLVFFPQERFRIPIIDPVLIVCAAALATREWNREAPPA